MKIIDNREFIMVNRKQFETFLNYFKDKITQESGIQRIWVYVNKILVAYVDDYAEYIAKDFIESQNYDLNTKMVSSKKEHKKWEKALCDEFDRLFKISCEAQFKKPEEMTEEERKATEFIDSIFFTKGTIRK